ncbi:MULTISPECIES: hypothetical protein [Prauserella salsuginis group]|uniref:Excreted virulence factor EspC (Type VII ESX diderm) n=2 Tax=Prauserella salsuginis group TaxID=2893672 RepID=A0A839XBE7_9PSEU|nr:MULTISPECIES: hypothetical protein [Prauserella salsuginis group]MBB3661302.1 hypothetical protein [Prauserella sediminis]MCR3719224.1 hypothetical protein [Prauserella flava]MCR3735763.1 hypothetical protein [Prauserella salsuginis]
MSRQFDPDHIAELASKVGRLKDNFSKASTDLGDGNPGGAFGDLNNAASAGKTMQHFYNGVNSELSAAANLVDAASQALSSAAERMRTDEDEGVHTFRGNDPELA